MAYPEVDSPATQTLFTFSEDTPPDSWGTQNDVVMGGCSSSEFTVTDDGHGKFTGHVSLDNNGGFASIVHSLDQQVDLAEAESFQLLLKGDGKTYTFRVKAAEDQNYFFQADFPTKTQEDWETISIPFSSMEAYHHGEAVDVPNYTGSGAVRLQLLIGNEKEQKFTILLSSIKVI